MYLPLSWPLLVMLGAISAGAGAAPHNLAIRGADVSTLAELEHLGVHYQDETRQGDLLTLMRERGLNLVRLRLWVDPRSAKGEPFGGGNNDLEKVIALAQRSGLSTCPGCSIFITATSGPIRASSTRHGPGEASRKQNWRRCCTITAPP